MILEEIINKKREEVEKKKIIISEFELKNSINKKYHGNFKKAISKKGISIIGEIKKASPSRGLIKEDFNPSNIAYIYDRCNIDAISILTEKNYFNGDDSYIKVVKNITQKPVLRKDFIIDEYQIYESKVLGADAILLIAEVLEENIFNFYMTAKNIGLDVLAEVHDKKHLYLALDAGCDIIGINNRNLKNFEVDLSTTQKIIKYIPEGILKVSESGIKTPEDIQKLNLLGIDGVLVGETFMKYVDDIFLFKNFIYESRKEEDFLDEGQDMWP